MKALFNKSLSISLSLSLLLAFAGCGDEKSSTPVPEVYEFESRFEASASSVAYTGQTARHIIIADLATYLSRLDAAIQAGGGGDFSGIPFFDPEDLEVSCEADLVAAFNRYFRAGVDDIPWLDDEEMLLSTDPPKLPSQVTYGDVSSAKNLIDKLAGNDTDTDSVDWSSSLANAVLIDVGQEPVQRASSPTELVDLMLEKLAQLACEALAEGGSEDPFFVDESGIDHKQLLQKFLLGGVAFSQGADDYLDDDVEGKGLLAPNTRDVEAPYTKLEHQWDEGFGYYGAARHTLSMEIGTIASAGHEDADGDGFIDLRSEKSFGASTNAAKRDRGACIATQISDEGMRAFIAGRHLIANAGEELDAAELEELKVHRDAAVLAWEQAIAATAIHYANDTLADLDALRADDGTYSRADHAKHWSELVGFLMSLQFNPHSQWLVRGTGPTEEYFGLLQLAGPAPRVDEDAEADLVALRDALGEAYGFDVLNVAGDGGDCAGW